MSEGELEQEEGAEKREREADGRKERNKQDKRLAEGKRRESDKGKIMEEDEQVKIRERGREENDCENEGKVTEGT